MHRDPLADKCSRSQSGKPRNAETGESGSGLRNKHAGLEAGGSTCACVLGKHKFSTSKSYIVRSSLPIEKIKKKKKCKRNCTQVFPNHVSICAPLSFGIELVLEPALVDIEGQL